MDISLEDYVSSDGVALAHLVRTRQIAPQAPLAAAVALSDALASDLNAIVERFDAAARAEAAAVPMDAPLAGVPFLVKDNNVFLTGRRPRNGSRFFRDTVSAAPESAIARIWRESGLVTFGRTNMPEFAHSYSTEPRAYGPVRNPWSAHHSTGGSSGGAAAAVAACIVPAAHGNDAAGSIRVPAAACGLFGLKPTRGFTSLWPHYLEVWHGLNVDHVLTRSVRDSAVFLDIARSLRCRVAEPLYARLTPAETPLRVGMSFATTSAAPIDPACRSAVLRAADLLAAMGHEVVEASFPAAPNTIVPALVSTGIAQTIAEEEARIGRAATPDNLEPAIVAILAMARAFSAVDLTAAIRAREQFELIAGDYFGRFDLYLSPVTATPPPLLGVLDGSRMPFNVGEYVAALQDYAPYTASFNISGQPAMSVPMGFDADGLPLGVQIAAAHWREDLLIQVALAIEAAAPWAGRTPSILNRLVKQEGRDHA